MRMNFVRSAMVAFLSFLFLNAYAATDPVSWSLSPSTGFPSTQVGSTSTVIYTLTNHIPHPTKLLTEITSHNGVFRVTDGCNQQTIATGSSCIIAIAYAPTAAGTATIRLIYGYHNNRIPLPTLTATATGHSSTEIVHGVISGLPPAFTITNPEQKPIFSAIYTNTGSVDVIGYAGNNIGANVLATSPTSVATVALLSNTCGTSGGPLTLRPGDSCTVTGQLTPVSVGAVTVQGLYTYDGGNKTATPSASSQVINGSGGCIVHGYASLPLPTDTYKYADNVVQFTFENECTSASATLGSVSLTSNSAPPATITTNTVYDLCSNMTLAAGGSCTVTASVIPKATGPLLIKAAVQTGSGTASATTKSTVATNQQSTHHILFINQCPFTVWYGIANGDSTNCPGPHCLTPDPNLIQLPTGTGAPDSAYRLVQQVSGSAPSTIDLSLSSYQNGAFWPRTGCRPTPSEQFICATGTCSTITGSATCVSTTGTLSQPQNPNTRFEATIQSTPGTDGVYDTSVINGMTVPVEVKAFGPATGNTAGTVYNCSAAGAIIQPSDNDALGACTWNFDPSSTLSSISNVNNDFYWVTPGPDDACLNGCGMAYDTGPSNTTPVSGTPINRRSAGFLAFNPLANDIGYTSTAQWGSVNLFLKYGMGTEIKEQNIGTNYGTTYTANGTGGSNIYNSYYQLLGCTPDTTSTTGDSGDSCYNSLDADKFTQCCGCINWTNTLPSIKCGSKGKGYINGQNFDWTTNTVPGLLYTIGDAIRWLKNACPTAYSYQFDDPSSSFQCNYDGSKALMTSYQVTFCPGGISGLPAGATEGRATRPV